MAQPYEQEQRKNDQSPDEYFLSYSRRLLLHFDVKIPRFPNLTVQKSLWQNEPLYDRVVNGARDGRSNSHNGRQPKNRCEGESWHGFKKRTRPDHLAGAFRMSKRVSRLICVQGYLGVMPLRLVHGARPHILRSGR